MSVIDSHRPSSASERFRRIFSSSQSQVGRRKQTSPIVGPYQIIPGLGRELSISEIGQVAGKIGRYLRIFCEYVCPSAKFKTIFVQTDDSVSQCIEKVVAQLTSEDNNIHGQCALFEVIGRLPANSKAINESGSVNDPGEVFSELSSRPLLPNENLLNVFSLMTPAPGLCRRLELRKQAHSLLVPPSRSRSRVDSGRSTPKRHIAPMIAPYCPYLLLIKGSRPENDFIVHNFSNICRGRLGEVRMGTSEYDDIRLYLSPDARIHRENIIVNGKGYVDSESPIRFAAKDLQGNGKSKSIWLTVTSTYNAIQPESPLMISLNWETLTDSNTLPVSRCLEPGDILRIDASNLVYVYIYKDSETVPEHKLSLGFLTLPQLPPIGGKPPIGQNGNRSAARTARIDALVRKTSSSSNHSINSSSVLPKLSNVDAIIGTLFPRTHHKGGDSNWGETGGILPDVGVAAGCFAHLLRSVVKHGVETGGQNYVSHINEDELLREINQALARELAKLNKLASQHLIPAIWESAFCFYLAQYLSPGWLKSVVNVHQPQPSIRVVERRHNSRARVPDRNSNSSNTDSPSDVFTSPLQRPRRLNINSTSTTATNSDVGEGYDGDFEHLPALSMTRDKVAAEAEAVMNQAVQQSLNVGLREVTKLCRLFGSAPSSETSRQIREAQTALFGKLDWTGDAITQTLTTRSQQAESPSGWAIRLTQAQPYNDRDLSVEGRNVKALEVPDGGDSSRDSSLRRNDSSVIDSEEGEGTSSPGSSSLHIDDEIHSTPGEEEDTGFGGSTTGGSTKGARQRIESIFFCRFLVGLSKRIIEEFVNNRELVINWETGTQVLNLVKGLSKWMHNAGVQNYKEALQLLNDFARMMATPRQELISMSWQQMRMMRPNLPTSLLYFLLINYENGRTMREIRDWSPNDETAIRGSPINSINEYVTYWQETERLYVPPKLQRIEPAYRPPDLATLFSTVTTKIAVDSFDSALAERHLSFRWSALLKSYHPPASVLKDSGSVSSSGIHTNGSRLTSQQPDLIRAKQRGSSDSSDFRDFAELNTEVNASKVHGFDIPEIPRPTLSSEGPSRSILAGRPYNYRRATASELGGVKRTAISELGGVRRADIQHVVPVPGGGFRSRAGVYDLGASSPHLQDLLNSGAMSTSRRGNCARRTALQNLAFSASSLNISQSLDRRGDAREVQKIKDDWSEFKRSLSRPTTPSTIEPDAETLNGSFSLHPPSVMSQSAYSVGTFPSRRRGDSLSSFMDGNLRKSQQSLISVDLDRPAGSAVMNVQLEKIANEPYGLKFVEGQLTRFGQLGVYVKSITPVTSASRANIEVGDRILAINGKDVTGMTFKETCDLLKENVSRVTLTIQRGLVENPDDLLYS